MKGIVKVYVVWAALSSTPAVAADLVSAATPEPAAEAGWTYSVTPYFRAAGLSGETSQFGLPGNAKACRSDFRPGITGGTNDD